jgi:hypothetical protein
MPRSGFLLEAGLGQSLPTGMSAIRQTGMSALRGMALREVLHPTRRTTKISSVYS